MNVPIIGGRDTASITTQASIEVQPVVIPRAIWKVRKGTVHGKPSIKFEQRKGTWFAFVMKLSATESIAVPLLSCPACAMILMLATEKSQPGIMSLLGHAVPVTHAVTKEGKVSPDIRCDPSSARRCGFHRQVYLDKWHSWRPLYVCAYTSGKSLEIKFAYSHAASRTEARMHLGIGDYNVIDVGRAVGALYDEKNKSFTADVGSKLMTPEKR
jgi:hypothetical protein